MVQAAVQLSLTEQLLAAAMELPEPERAMLVQALLRSLSPLADEGVALDEPPLASDPVLTTELQRRRRAYLSGETGSVSVEQLEDELTDVLTATHR
jgi:Putative addiction module component